MSQTYRDAVAEHFRAHPGIWLDGMAFASVGGCYAFRTRISDCRTQLGMQIENRQRRVGRRIVSEYRYLPHVTLLQLMEAS